MYRQEITRHHRTAFVIAIDQSQSMQEEVLYNGRTLSKAAAVAEITDYLINELILRARRDDRVRDYYDIAIMGYSDDEVYPLIVPERYFISVTELALYKPVAHKRVVERRLPDGEMCHYVEEHLVWIAPRAYGNTPMYEAMMQIRDIVGEWCSNPHNVDSFPPVIFNISDGQCSDCSDLELLAITEQIRNLGTRDGNALLINIHLASGDRERAVVFPSDSEIDADNHDMRVLAECSSIMPEPFNDLIRSQRGPFAVPPFRAMSYNASLTELITMLNIGSRSITNIF